MNPPLIQSSPVMQAKATLEKVQAGHDEFALDLYRRYQHSGFSFEDAAKPMILGKDGAATIKKAASRVLTKRLADFIGYDPGTPLKDLTLTDYFRTAIALPMEYFGIDRKDLFTHAGKLADNMPADEVVIKAGMLMAREQKLRCEAALTDPKVPVDELARLYTKTRERYSEVLYNALNNHHTIESEILTGELGGLREAVKEHMLTYLHRRSKNLFGITTPKKIYEFGELLAFTGSHFGQDDQRFTEAREALKNPKNSNVLSPIVAHISQVLLQEKHASPQNRELANTMYKTIYPETDPELADKEVARLAQQQLRLMPKGVRGLS